MTIFRTLLPPLSFMISIINIEMTVNISIIELNRLQSTDISTNFYTLKYGFLWTFRSPFLLYNSIPFYFRMFVLLIPNSIIQFYSVIFYNLLPLLFFHVFLPKPTKNPFLTTTFRSREILFNKDVENIGRYSQIMLDIDV